MFRWFGPLPFFAVHFACIAAFFLKFHWSYLIVCLALYYVRMFFVTAGYHRYFSHRSFKTSRFFQFVMALMATTSTQKGVLWWAANHRHHHRYSDTEDDAFTFATGFPVVAYWLDSLRPLHHHAGGSDSRLLAVSGAALAEQCDSRRKDISPDKG